MRTLLLLLPALLFAAHPADAQEQKKKKEFKLYAAFKSDTRVELADGAMWMMDKGDVFPVLAYPHGPGCAVTGGYVIRDPRLSRIAGREIIGRYIFGDYCTGRLTAFRVTPKGRSKERKFPFRVPYLTSFAEDRSGRIYLLSQRGPIYRMDPARKPLGD